MVFERSNSHPKIVDVARAAQVSRQTVSNVLNAPERVRAETRARVLVEIERLGYRSHTVARNLRTRSTRLIGYRVPPAPAGPGQLLLDRFLHALTEAARERGYHVALFVANDDDD